MPVYVFECPFCKDRNEFVYRHVKDRNKDLECEKCQEIMIRTLTAHKTKPFTPYYHKQIGQYFQSRSEEKSYAKKNGLVNISGDFGKHISHANERF